MRTMGLDVGSKTIGVAMSDEAGLIAQPLLTIKRASLAKDLEEVARLLGEYSAGLIVVGLPVNMDGTIGAQAQNVQKFIDKLREKVDIQVAAWDERLSTAAVERLLIEGDVSRAKRKKAVDKLAASYILQGFLDSRKTSR